MILVMGREVKSRTNMKQFDNAEKLDVVITHAYNRIAYNILRSLSQKGLKIGVGNDLHSGMCEFSRLAAVKFRHPPFYREPERFIQRVVEVLSRYNPSIYIPPDEDAFVVAKYIAAFSHLPVNIPVAPYETIRMLDNKSSSTRLAASIGIPTPVTITPTDIMDIISFGRQFPEPAVLKLTESSGAHGVFYLHKKNMDIILDHVFNEMNIPLESTIVQEYVRGTGYGVSMLFNKGNLRARFTHRRIMEKNHTGGPSSIRVSARNPVLEEYAEQILAKVNYHGVAMVEFKFDENSRKAVFMEVNPRFWGSHGLAIFSGVDFPYLLYRVAMESDIAPVLNYRVGVKAKWVLGTILGTVDEIKSSKRLSSIRALFSHADAFDDLYFDDLGAFGGQAFSGMKKVHDNH